MVDPIYLLAIPFLTAFLLPLIYKAGRKAAFAVFALLLVFLAALPLQLFLSFLQGQPALLVETAGFPPPFSISLRFGPAEILAVLGANLTALFSGLLLAGRLGRNSAYGLMLFAILTLAVDGLIVTRDLFNMFVFMEIAAISTYGLIGAEKRALEAGFKYALAGGVASIFYLIGTIYIYRVTGSLNIDALIEAGGISPSVIGRGASFFLVAALLIELKSFPANGWALDVYQTAPALSAVISGGSAGAMLFALHKVLPIIPSGLLALLAGVGLVSFLFSNLLALGQTDARRMLGYSSIGYIGLLLFVIVQARTIPGLGLFGVAGALFLNHLLAKAGLFWLAAGQTETDRRKWRFGTVLGKVVFGVLLAALAGFPPFPGFWGKWKLVLAVAGNGSYWTVGILLLGSLFEAAYLFRWFGDTVTAGKADTIIESRWIRKVPAGLFALALAALGVYLGQGAVPMTTATLFPLTAALLLFLLDGLPQKFKGILAMALVGGYGYLVYPSLEFGIPLMFSGLFLIGGILHLLASLYKSRDKRQGYYPLTVLLILSLPLIVSASSALSFFFAWELMALSSYFLILRGEGSARAAQRYLVFSTASAFFILAGFSLTGGTFFSDAAWAPSPPAVLLLMTGLLVKTGALGVHLWLPGAYAEAEDDTSSFFSSVLSKVPVFVFIGVIAASAGLLTGGGTPPGIDFTILLSWIGALTALGGTLLAVFQEDIKKTLAYSSMGQLGYIVLAVAMANHFGWTTALYLTLNHFLFKTLLWLGIAGVIYKTGTRMMYQMGGLIKQMPLTFISVLMAIIALSGVPPWRDSAPSGSSTRGSWRRGGTSRR